MHTPVAFSYPASASLRLQSASTGINVFCPAKINLFLEVVGLRADGYHDLDTLMVGLQWFDVLEITPTSSTGVRLMCNNPHVPLDESNTLRRAAAAFEKATGMTAACTVHLHKHLPTGAGLGGGSSDGAGMLLGLNQIHGNPLNTAKLEEIAAIVGSDVAFFIRCAPARCTGRGEIIHPLEPFPDLFFVVATPPISISTAAVYAEMKKLLTHSKDRVSFPSYKALESAGTQNTAFRTFNRLEQPALKLAPELVDWRTRLSHVSNAHWHMTGSGSSFFTVCASAQDAETLARATRGAVPGQFVATRLLKP